MKTAPPWAGYCNRYFLIWWMMWLDFPSLQLFFLFSPLLLSWEIKYHIQRKYSTHDVSWVTWASRRQPKGQLPTIWSQVSYIPESHKLKQTQSWIPSFQSSQDPGLKRHYFEAKHPKLSAFEPFKLYSIKITSSAKGILKESTYKHSLWLQETLLSSLPALQVLHKWYIHSKI